MIVIESYTNTDMVRKEVVGSNPAESSRVNACPIRDKAFFYVLTNNIPHFLVLQQ